MLHQEINRLPERYRVAVVLCDLEGQTHTQAARNLGWPVGAVKSRLARARERLRARLVNRGLAPAGGLAAVVELATGVLKTMMLAKFRVLGVSLLVIVIATGAGILVRGDGPSAAQSPEIRHKRADDMPVFEATTGTLSFIVTDRGSDRWRRPDPQICSARSRVKPRSSGSCPRARGSSGFGWRVVTLGLANEELVEVREGLQDGDLVAADPISLMSEEERRARFGKSTKPAEPPTKT